jgi:cytochrome d ubiquinol oxidase subunit I
MHYPWWYVPVLTAPMLIAAISVLHVIVSHYAVGGGIFLAVETQYAYRHGRSDYLAYLKRHAWFFILVTVVYGAITGVGIWWTIGLASPLATESLIHIFVFGWAMEYVLFVVEIVSAFAFFYLWGRAAPRVHVAIGWIYAVAAWASLVLITGITAFMLNPGPWVERPGFWVGFFNPQLVPQVLVRTGGALLLACLYVCLHAAFSLKDGALRELVGRRSARPALLGAVLVIVGGAAWAALLPASARDALAAASALNILLVIVFAVSAVVFAMLYLGPYRNPGWISPGFAILLFGAGLAAITAGEYVREGARKPYVIYDTVMGNQILRTEIPEFRERGYLESGVWTSAYVRATYPEVVSNGQIDEPKLLQLDPSDQIELGKVLFQHHCNDCHAATMGYTAVAPMIHGWTPAMLEDLVHSPERHRFFMPPWAGTDAEATLLAKYLATIAPTMPPGMDYAEPAESP